MPQFIVFWLTVSPTWRRASEGGSDSGPPRLVSLEDMAEALRDSG
ncbi:MAG: hypothetical protein Q6366_017940 [Candidatus Freyarchaeota archaeon]